MTPCALTPTLPLSEGEGLGKGEGDAPILLRGPTVSGVESWLESLEGVEPFMIPTLRSCGRSWTCARRLSGRVAGILLLAGIVALGAGCSLLRAPQQVVTAVLPASGSKQPDPMDLQLQIQRFTDEFNTRTFQALDEYALRVGTEAARVEALQLELTSGTSLIGIASGPNPSANLVDLVAVVTLTRMTVQDYWIKTPNGPAFQPWLEACQTLESNVWKFAATAFNESQINELREGIQDYCARNPEVQRSFFLRPHEFAALVTTSHAKAGDLGSVFSVMGLDPTAGLDPAVREVTRTRLFAERAMFTLQRMPFLVRGHAELLAYRLADMTEVRQALTNTARLSDSADRISRAAESVSQTAAQLPDRIATERKEILAALEQQEGKLRNLATEVNRTLVAGEAMSTSLHTTLTTFDALMKRFGVGEPETNAVPDTNAPPFNILDYGKVATDVGGMAKDLNTLLTSVNQSVPHVALLGQQATADAGRVVQRAFWLGLVLILVLLGGSMLAALAYRILVAKWIPTEPRPSSSPP